MSTRTLAIMFTDIKGFTARTSEENREELNRLLDEHDRLLRPAFARFGGTVVKTIGDAFLVWFASPTDAVVCGVVIQEVLRKHNASDGVEPLNVRVAINVGDVEIRKTANGTDLFGEAVNLASRLEGIAEAGEVWFTEAVYLTMNRHEVPTAEIGERTFKGIPNPVRVFKVIEDPKSDQLSRIAAAVRLEGGAPVFGDAVPRSSAPTGGSPVAIASPDPARQPAPRSAGRRMLAVIGAVGLLAAIPAAWAGMASSWDRGVAKRAEERIAQHDPQAALDLVDERLRARPHDVLLITIGTRAANQVVDAKAKDDVKEALGWAQRQIAAKPWLSGLASRLPLLETEVALDDASGDLGKIDQISYDMMAKYPKDPDIPWVAAGALTASGVMTASITPLLETALDNGHAPDPDGLAVCTDFAFHEFDPGARWSESCQRMVQKWYAEPGLKWAQHAFDEGNSNEMLNAFQILDAAHDARTSDPLWVSVRDLLTDHGTGDAVVSEKDPARRERARSLLWHRLHWGGELDDAQKTRMQDVLATLGKAP